jgi:immune inhibitor A
MGLAGLALAASITGGAALTAAAAPPEDGVRASSAPVVDELSNPVEEKRRALREAALKQVIAGKAEPRKRGASTVVKLDSKAPGGEDQYVELAREKTDKIFVVLAEFGDERHPSYPDQDTNKSIPGPTTWNGPVRNKIPAPDRSKDNSTVWQPDYDRNHFQQMYFGKGEGVESLKTYYERQSSGRYSVDGLVTDWVKVRYNEARYGRSDGTPCTSNVCSNTWSLIPDAIQAWVDSQTAAGMKPEDIKKELAGFDTWDRNDYDDDGDFNEADGYIDHFQIVHAGGD